MSDERDFHVAFLSHVVGADTPAYGGGIGFSCEHISCIATGDTANSSRWCLPNHLGTHVDVPRHFFDSGESVDHYSASDWCFERPILVDVSVADDALIMPSLIADALPIDADLLLIRTGFEAHRHSQRYWQRNPGLSAELGVWLRSFRPRVRAVGMDLISATAREHRLEGRLAHRAFLEPTGEGHPVLLIEDMALQCASEMLRKVIVAPLRAREANGGPCTVMGWFDRGPEIESE